MDLYRRKKPVSPLKTRKSFKREKRKREKRKREKEPRNTLKILQKQGTRL
jgi:hypothetical protein